MHINLAEFLTGLDFLSIKNKNNINIKKVVTKSNRISENTLFFHIKKEAIEYERLEHIQNFVIVTEDKRVIDHHLDNENGTFIYVKNIQKAYWDFIDFYRGKFQIPVIGITGTCGKTTTKEIIIHILQKKYNVQGTFMSQNGLHMNLRYLLDLKTDTDIAIFEMGVAYQGNIKHSGKYFKPTIGVITNIGEAHLEGCKTLENYVKAKGEMLEILPDDGTLIFNGDDDIIRRLPIGSFKGKTIAFGLQELNDFRASHIKYESNGMSYQLHHEGEIYLVSLRGFGVHHVYNSLAAITVAHMVGVSIESSIERLSTFKELPRHVSVGPGLNGCTVIDDTWSCNPTSVKSAIEVLNRMSSGKKRVLVLGKMQRLGRQLREQHKKLGETIIEMGGVDYLITIGEAASLTGKKLLELGIDRANVLFLQTAAELEEVLNRIATEYTIVLFKMSLGKMDKSFRKVVDKFRLKSK